MTVERLLNEISSKELSEWQAFYSIEPFGEERADMRSALVATVMANAWKDKKQRAYKMKDFMLNFEPAEPQSVDSMKAILKGMCP